MMNNNVSPLEAQAFNYVSFGFITILNNFWTWLALTFWRTRTPSPELLPPPQDLIREEPDSDPVSVTGPTPAFVPGPTVLGNGPNGPVDGLRKGKFTFYYQDEVERECQWDVTVTEEVIGVVRQEWWETWERLLTLRRGDNDKGWYTCLDLTALNGSVVRLWNDDAASFTTQFRNSKTCVLLYGNNI